MSEEGTPSSPHPWRRSPETKPQRKTDPRRTADMDRPNPKLPRSSLGKQELYTGRPILPVPPSSGDGEVTGDEEDRRIQRRIEDRPRFILVEL